VKRGLLVVIAILGATAADRPRVASHRAVRAASLEAAAAHPESAGNSAFVDAAWLRGKLGVDGAGIGIATIDSGIALGHDDLRSVRVVHWADFVSHLPVPYDDYGHGTHVAGIIAGAGAGPGGASTGIAPRADLIVLKALDGAGNGQISDVVAAVDYAVAHRARYNIRAINLSVAAGVHQSHQTDPLAQAALRAVRAGIVVVAAAGNFGLSPAGEPRSRSIAAPGNAPWVLTVGASDGMGTLTRSDDVVASFSSRGPAAIDETPKPDIVAPGVGVVSAADPASTLYSNHWRARMWGTGRTESQPYLRLSGTSMAAPIVTGMIALMLQAAPQLTPNAVKGILQFTAEPSPGAPSSAQGAGLLNARGAVALARQVADRSADPAALEETAGGTARWGRQILWGARRVSADQLPLATAAWEVDVLWGARSTPRGEPITWPAP
jgi:serine protease AprX